MNCIICDNLIKWNVMGTFCSWGCGMCIIDDTPLTEEDISRTKELASKYGWVTLVARKAREGR